MAILLSPLKELKKLVTEGLLSNNPLGIAVKEVQSLKTLAKVSTKVLLSNKPLGIVVKALQP